MTETKKRAGKKADTGEQEKSVEQLTDEKLTEVAGGAKCFPERVCEPIKPCLPQCSPHCPPTRMCKPR